MILIVAHHYSLHGFPKIETYSVDFNKCLIDILSLGGKIGVACFILISGYFMLDSKFTIKKLWKIIGEVFFYSYGILILFFTILEPVKKITTMDTITSILPITYSAYWFITDYIILMIISPYLNKFIYSLNKVELRNFIICMVYLWSIYKIITTAELGYNDLGWFIVLYCIAAYIKLYVKFDKKKERKNKIILLTSILIFLILTIACNVLTKKTGNVFYLKNIRTIASLNSIFTTILSTTMFLYFCQKEKKYNRFINEISKYVLGVYLIHDNILLRPYLWNTILKNEQYYISNFLIIHAIISIILVFVTCLIIDYLRTKILEPLWMKLYEVLKIKLKKYNINFTYE